MEQTNRASGADATETPAPAGPAGGRMGVRVAVGLSVSAAVIGLLAWDHAAGGQLAGLTLLVVGAAVLGLDELAGILGRRGVRPLSRVVVPLAVVLLLLHATEKGHAVFGAAGLSRLDRLLYTVWHRLVDLDVLLIAAAALVLVVELAASYGRHTVLDAAATCFGFAYVWLPLSLVFALRKDFPHGEALVLFVLASNKVSDSAAYFGGRAFGRHRMAPVISPKKTWEGAAAGLVAGTAAGLGVLRLLVPGWGATAGAWWSGAAFAAVVVSAGQVGDLAESAIKRWAGVKDSARRLPEFGGVLDMIDSFLVSVPVAYLCLASGAGRLVFG